MMVRLILGKRCRVLRRSRLRCRIWNDGSTRSTEKERMVHLVELTFFLQHFILISSHVVHLGMCGTCEFFTVNFDQVATSFRPPHCILAISLSFIKYN